MSKCFLNDILQHCFENTNNYVKREIEWGFHTQLYLVTRNSNLLKQDLT